MGDERKPTGVIRWTDYRGKEQTRETRYVIDIRDYEGTAGFPLLWVAANRHLSIRLLEWWLADKGGKNKRSRGWVQRRRWMFEDPNAPKNNRSHPDGMDDRALALMRDNSTLSLRVLSKLLVSRGISRGKDWVRQHRGD